MTLRLLAAVACMDGAVWSLRLARADALFREDTAQSVRTAIRMVPDDSQYYMRLAQLDGGRAEEFLEKALTLNRYNAQAAEELGLDREADGDYPGAEKLMLQAFEVDRTYGTRWTLANFYFRRGDMPEFWKWARRAAAMPADDLAALFQLCWHAEGDASAIAGHLLTDQPQTIREYMVFLLSRGDASAAVSVAPRLLARGNPEDDRPLLLTAINRAVESGDGAPALSLWRALGRQRWVVSDGTLPNNAVFARDPTPVAFDWNIAAYDGLHSWPGASGLEVEFTGNEPENCAIAEQIVPLAPGDYEFRYSYRTRDIAPETGLHWEIQGPTPSVPTVSPDLSSETLKTESFRFTASGAALSLARLRLAYRRALGTPRISGMLVLVTTSIQPHR